jgi:hypothetical protein
MVRLTVNPSINDPWKARLLSHGERARIIDFANAATRLSDNASTIAAFLQLVANAGVIDQRLEFLQADVVTLADRLSNYKKSTYSSSYCYAFPSVQPDDLRGPDIEDLTVRLRDVAGELDAKAIDPIRIRQVAVELQKLANDLRAIGKDRFEEAAFNVTNI